MFSGTAADKDIKVASMRKARADAAFARAYQAVSDDGIFSPDQQGVLKEMIECLEAGIKQLGE